MSRAWLTNDQMGYRQTEGNNQVNNYHSSSAGGICARVCLCFSRDDRDSASDHKSSWDDAYVANEVDSGSYGFAVRNHDFIT